MDKKLSSEAEKRTFYFELQLAITFTIALVISILRNSQFVKDRLGFNAQAFDNINVWLLALVIAFFYTIYTIKAVPFIKDYLFVFSWLKVVSIWSTLVAGIFEELIFRQLLMDWIMRLNYGIIIQVLVSAIIFGLAHSVWVLFGGELKVALPVILSTTMLGGLLAILYILADRNLLAPIVAHILINLVIEPWLVLSGISGDMGHSKK